MRGLAALPPGARHLRAAFGPVTLFLAGPRSMLDLTDGGWPRLRLTWTDLASTRPDHLVSARLARLLLSPHTQVLDHPNQLAAPLGGRLTDPEPTPPAIPTEIRVTPDQRGVALTITLAPDQRRGCHLDHADAIELAAVLHTWAWLPPRRAAERMARVPAGPR